MIYPSKTHHFWRISLLFSPVLVDVWWIFSIHFFASAFIPWPGSGIEGRSLEVDAELRRGIGAEPKDPLELLRQLLEMWGPEERKFMKKCEILILDDIGYSWMVTFKQQDWGLPMMNASQNCRPRVMTFPSWTIGSQWTLLIHPRDVTFLLGTGIVGGILPVPHSCVFSAVSCGRRNEAT